MKIKNKITKVEMRKKLIMILFILIMLLSNIKYPVFAIETDEEKYNYTISNNEVIVQGIKPEYANGNVVIPETIKNLPVRKISMNAFRYCESIESIIIPDSVTSIGDSAFYQCTNLKNITISNNITSIEEMAFFGCISLESINIPDSLTSISLETFAGCTSLKNITIPESVTSIGHQAFAGCTSLENIEIPNSVTSIEELAFNDCASLTSIDVSNKNINYSSIDGVLFNKDKTKLIDYPENKKDIEYSIPDSVKEIEPYAFSLCKNLKKVIISKGVTNIDWNVFQSASSITSVIIPDSVTSIGGNAFLGCSNLKNVTIPNSVISIEDTAFDGCTNLEIYGYKGSYAETYANEKNIKFVAIGEGDEIEDTPEIIRKNKKGSFKCVDRTFSGEKGYIYNDNFFDGHATTYNHHLATMSLCLAYSAYNTNSEKFYTDEEYKKAETYANVYDLLNNCGFSNFKQYNYDVKPTMNNVACAIASKPLESGDTLIAIAVRGGGYESEWGSNFDVGKVGDHDGFEKMANIVYDRLTDYINSNTINGNIKIWITGFSRAGATANLCAAKLSKVGAENELSKKLNKPVSFDNADVYAYCFATPAGADNSNNKEPNNDQYRNIFSIVHYYDLVPLVAPAYWNFDRYGKTYIFLHKETSKETIKYEANMLKRLSNQQRAEYAVMHRWNWNIWEFGNCL